MKRTALLLVTFFLCSATFLFAGDKSKKPVEVTGWVCNAKCVDQSSGQATCNKNCSETGGEVVFINEATGHVSRITDQQMAKPMSGKRCKMKAMMDPDTGALAPQNIVEYEGP